MHKFSGDPRPVQRCSECHQPLDGADHSQCSIEIDIETMLSSHREILYKLSNTPPDEMTPEERNQVSEYSYYFLKIRYIYDAIDGFRALQDYAGLRQTIQFILNEKRGSFELPRVLLMLEEHELIQKLLNEGVLTEVDLKNAFEELRIPVYSYIRKFLNRNNTPIATGIVNEGFDLVALHNLREEFDIAVPIARGGLNQGAIANLFGMTTKIVNISAHKRKKPRGTWVSPVQPEDFKGKSILLLDKDAVTGATIQHMVKMLKRFNPRRIGVYFAYPVRNDPGIGTHTEGLPEGIEIFSPHNAPTEHAGDAYMEAHEKLDTLYGQRRIIEREYNENILPQVQEHSVELAEALKKFLVKHLKAFDSLNQQLPGVSAVREKILRKLKRTPREYFDPTVLEVTGSEEGLKKMLETTEALPFEFEADLVSARYNKKAEQNAQKRSVENPHLPSSPLEAFAAAQLAVEDGYDYALIIGPEGFAYEPYFQDLGLPTVSINIPESMEGQTRTLQPFDDLSLLKGKKVLVVEDDVQTGATLQKTLEAVEQHPPTQIGLYLGQPETFQKIENIPPKFTKIYMAKTDHESIAMAKQKFHAHLNSKGLRIFK